MGPIFKLTGCGNNFLFIDWRDKSTRKSLTPVLRKKNRTTFARELCDRDFSIGADGLLFLEKSKVADIKWDFYNADGSRAEMCGNAARCVGAFEYAKLALKPNNHLKHLRFTLETRAGVIDITAHKANLIEVRMPTLRDFDNSGFVRVAGQKIPFCFVNSGVPHAVVKLPKILNVDKLGHIVDNIRLLSQFKRNGTNVTFYKQRGTRAIDSLTFERGVQGYTQACGTGAIAAAFCFLATGKNTQLGKNLKVTVRVPGGTLLADFTGGGPRLIGPAEFIGRIELLPVKI